MTHQTPPYYLGLPAWAHSGWKNRYFSSDTSSLASYSSVFNCVEGNTTFYSTPDPASVLKWHSEVMGTHFKFCFKTPRSVTHEAQSDWKQLNHFFQTIAPLGANLGPFILQFPAHFSPNDLPRLKQILSRLPTEHRYAIEVRHLQFFEQPQLLEPLIEKFNLGRVMFDSRPLFSGDLNHPEVLQAKHKKPQLPVLTQVYNDIALVRLILHPNPHSNQKYIDEWLKFSAQSINSNHQPIMMVHCANNDHSPKFALEFHQSLMSQASLNHRIPPLSDWPVPQQGSLL